MAGRGPAPKPDEERRRQNDPAHPWNFAGGQGWQHGEIPKPPTRMLKVSRDAWRTWFSSWIGWFWGPEDLPGLRQVIRAYDQVERGELKYLDKLRMLMDNYGITPKGQQDRRWRPPRPAPKNEPVEESNTPDRWAGLKVLDGGA